MAWTDQCKIEACNQVKHKAEAEGISPKAAIAKLAEDSGIPAKTIEHWFYGPARQPENSGDENPQAPPPPREKDQQNHCEAFAKKMKGALRYAVKNIDLPLQCDGDTTRSIYYFAGKIEKLADDMRRVTP